MLRICLSSDHFDARDPEQCALLQSLLEDKDKQDGLFVCCVHDKFVECSQEREKSDLAFTAPLSLSKEELDWLAWFWLGKNWQPQCADAIEIDFLRIRRVFDYLGWRFSFELTFPEIVESWLSARARDNFLQVTQLTADIVGVRNAFEIKPWRQAEADVVLAGLQGLDRFSLLDRIEFIRRQPTPWILTMPPVLPLMEEEIVPGWLVPFLEPNKIQMFGHRVKFLHPLHPSRPSSGSGLLGPIKLFVHDFESAKKLIETAQRQEGYMVPLMPVQTIETLEMRSIHFGAPVVRLLMRRFTFQGHLLENIKLNQDRVIFNGREVVASVYAARDWLTGTCSGAIWRNRVSQEDLANASLLNPTFKLEPQGGGTPVRGGALTFPECPTKTRHQRQVAEGRILLKIAEWLAAPPPTAPARSSWREEFFVGEEEVPKLPSGTISADGKGFWILDGDVRQRFMDMLTSRFLSRSMHKVARILVKACPTECKRYQNGFFHKHIKTLPKSGVQCYLIPRRMTFLHPSREVEFIIKEVYLW